MSEVWLIAAGEYSDFHIICAVASEEIGNELVAKLNEDNSDHYCVMDVDLVTTSEIVEELRMSCHVSSTGVISREYDYMSKHIGEIVTGLPECEVNYRWMPGRNNIKTHRTSNATVTVDEGSGHLGVSGTDIERVRKVYSERKARLIADEAYRFSLSKRPDPS